MKRSLRKCGVLLVSMALALGATAAATVAAEEPTATSSSQVTEKVIIDADMGELNDDALAMFMLARADTVDVLGVTIVAGNTWAEEGTAYALKQLELIGRPDIPVVPGAGEPLMGNRQSQLEAEERLFGRSQYLGAFSRPRPASYLKLEEAPYKGYPETTPSPAHAVDFIVDQVKKHPDEITLFALGPATNIALAVKKNPEIVPLVKQIVYMGGAIDIPGNTTPAAEFNWWFDPESAKIALNTPFRKQIVVPNDIAERVFYTKAIYDRVVAGPATPITQMFKDLHGPRFAADPDSQSFVWDLLTAAIFLEPDIATVLEERYIDIDTRYGPDYGRSIGYDESRRRSFENPQDFPPNTQKVQILFDIDREAFFDLYVRELGKQE